MNRFWSALLTALTLFSPLALFAQNTITITDDDLLGGNSYTWTNDNVYLLQGEVYLETGGSLTIAPGTIIRGADESAALIIARNAQISAKGTANLPIIFTYAEDELCDPNDWTAQDRGLWKGLFILGTAPHTNESCLNPMPNLAPGEIRAFFGANDCEFNQEDSSGIIQYVSIRHSLVGLALGAVGRGTVIDHIEGYANEEGLEIYGGTVNLKYMVASFSGDDLFNWNAGWSGNGQFWFGIMDEGQHDNGGEHSDPHADSDGATLHPVIYNATYIGSGAEDPDGSSANDALVFNNSSGGQYINSIFTDFEALGIIIEDLPQGTPDSYEQMLNGNLSLITNIWWGFGNGNELNAGANGFIGVIPNAEHPTADDVRVHLLENNNDVVSPELNNISRFADGALDPRPTGDSPVYGNVSSVPNNGFFTSAGYRGAFNTDLWISNWTALADNGYLSAEQEIECDLSVSFEASEINCAGDNNAEIVLFPTGGSGGYTFDWEIDAFDGQQIVNGLPGGTYTVTITDNNCCTVIETIEIAEPPVLQLEACSSTTLVDDNGNVFGVVGVNIVGGTAGYAVTYEGPSTGTITVETAGQAQLTGLALGDYTIILGDAKGCLDSCFTTVEPLCNLSVNAIVQEITCRDANDGAINLTFSGGTPPLSFDWNDDNLDTIEDPNGLEPGQYTVTVTDANDCKDTVSVTLEQPATALELDYTNEHISSSGAVDGKITASITGGEPSYSVNLTGPVVRNQETSSGTVVFDNLPEGPYLLAVTDSRGCIQSREFEIEGCYLGFKSIVVTPPSCHGFSDGAIAVSMTNASHQPLTYDWDDSSIGNTPVPTGLVEGTYDLTVTDAIGCSVSGTFVLTDPDELTLSMTVLVADRSEIEDNGAIQASVFGGTAPYILRWTTTAGDSDSVSVAVEGLITLDSLSAGVYAFTLRDSKGCSVSTGTGIDNAVILESVFVVEPHDTFIVEYLEGITREEADSIQFAIEEQNGSLQRACNCQDSISRVQLWLAGETAIDISTTGQGSRTKVDPDTSGLGKILILNPDTTIQAPTSTCISRSGTGPKTDTVTVAVIDSGMDLKTDHNGEGHPLLSGIDWTNPSEVPDNKSDDDRNCMEDDLYGYDILNDTPKIIDRDGHGTHIAGIISDSFPNDIQLELMNLKIYEQGNGGVFDLICAIHHAINQGADVINLSLGYFNERPSKTLFNALKRAEEDSVLVIISAGNDTLDLDLSNSMPEYNRWPGKFKLFKQDTTFRPLTNLLVVAALNDAKTTLDLDYSNYGAAHVDIATDGIFTSTYLNQGERTLKGTSMSAAYVTRIAAIAKAKRPDLDAEEILQCIKSHSSPLNNPGHVAPSIKLHPNAVWDCLAIAPEDINYVVPEFPAGRGAITYSSIQFREDLTMTLGNGQVFYNDVELEITDGSKTLHSMHYCAANVIIWDGTGGNGNIFPSGPYFIKLRVGSKSFPVQKVIKI